MSDQLFWFALAVLPLIATPGPDIMLCIAQGMTRGRAGVWRAVNGISLGYLAHAGLASVGLAALVAASPTLFEIIRWLGIAYLFWLAFGMLRSALLTDAPPTSAVNEKLSLWKGFLTSFLNPKGLLMYLSVLPQFIEVGANEGGQALALSLTFVAMCYVVYATIGLLAVSAGRAGEASAKRTRILEGIAGSLLGCVALKLAAER